MLGAVDTSSFQRFGDRISKLPHAPAQTVSSKQLLTRETSQDEYTGQLASKQELSDTRSKLAWLWLWLWLGHAVNLHL